MAIGDKQKLITEIVSKVLDKPAETNKKFNWFINKHTRENFGKHYLVIDKVFNLLNGDIQANVIKRTVPLDCDAFFGGEYNFIFEFDEFQHFNSPRLKTFELYPNNLKVAYSIEQWTQLCKVYKEKADKYRRSKTSKDFNFSGGRTAQRAYLDCFRDLLPEIQGLNPTLRISEFEVLGITGVDKEACIKVEQLLKTKLS